MAVAAPRRRADRDEYRIGVFDGLREVRGEGEAAGEAVAVDQYVEAGLVDRDFAALQRLDLALVLVDADHLMSKVGEAGAGDKPDITRTNHCHTHVTTSAEKLMLGMCLSGLRR